MWRVEYSTLREVRDTFPAPPEGYFHHRIPALDAQEAALAVGRLLANQEIARVRAVRTS